MRPRFGGELPPWTYREKRRKTGIIQASLWRHHAGWRGCWTVSPRRGRRKPFLLHVSFAEILTAPAVRQCTHREVHPSAWWMGACAVAPQKNCAHKVAGYRTIPKLVATMRAHEPAID